MSSNSAGQAARRESAIDNVIRAFREFLTLPTIVICAFFVLAVATFLLDAHAVRAHDPVHEWLRGHLLGKPSTTADLLGIVAAGLITVTSIIVSLLLVAIQQSATAMSMAVFDQFLRRRQNQFYFGFFVGLALYAILTLATAHNEFNPVYGGFFAIVATVAALYLLIVLMYTTINQMRPAVVIDAIRQHATDARKRQQALLCSTSRSVPASQGKSIRSAGRGYVTSIALDAVREALADAPQVAVVFRATVGTFVAIGDKVAEIHGGAPDSIDRAVLGSIRLEQQRDITHDPSYAIEQIETIAWTSISSAKSNPEPGLTGIDTIRALFAEWSVEQDQTDRARDAASPQIVYPDDSYGTLFDALESLAIAASESREHQSAARAILALVNVYDAVPLSWRPRADTMVMRLVTTLGEHVLSVRLENALQQLAIVLDSLDRPTRVQRAVTSALEEMRDALGKPARRGECVRKEDARSSG